MRFVYTFAMSEDRIRLLNHIANDGSRQFAAIPARIGWDAMRQQLALQPDVTVTSFITDGVTQATMDFDFRGHQFTMDSQYGEYWIFVSDPDCPDELLITLLRLL